MATQVRETSAGKSVSAYVVLNKKGEHVATVNAHFSNGGTCTVDVWNIGDSAAKRCLAAALKSGDVTPAVLEKAVKASKARRDWGDCQRHEDFAAYDLFGLQQGRAGGYGYDKFAAAISGLWIDGFKIADHSGTSAATKKLYKAYQAALSKATDCKAVEDQFRIKAAKIGAHFANYRNAQDGGFGGWGSLYLEAGLKRLETMGYKVIQAI